MRLICLILTVTMLMLVSGTESIKPNENMTSDTIIDYGESEIFSLEDRQKAVTLILNEVCDWNAIEQLYNVRFGGDEASLQEKGFDGYDTIMVFYSDFKTKADRTSDSGFNPDFVYRNWNWIIGKTSKGPWKLLDWGY